MGFLAWVAWHLREKVTGLAVKVEALRSHVPEEEEFKREISGAIFDRWNESQNDQHRADLLYSLVRHLQLVSFP